MSYEIRGPVREGVWSVTYTGQVRVGERMRALAEFERTVDADKLIGVFVDFRDAVQEMSTYDEFSFATELSGRSLFIGKRIAIVLPSDVDGPSLFLTAAQNRGVLARTFHNEEEAWEFLTPRPRTTAAH